MDFRRAATVVWGCALLCVLARASVPETPPDSTASPFAAGAKQVKPVNLKVLPPDVTTAELGHLMKGFERDLGVTCSHCHVEDPATRKFDYASDENPTKAQARLMITMLKDIKVSATAWQRPALCGARDLRLVPSGPEQSAGLRIAGRSS
jgi:hypothetical protein